MAIEFPGDREKGFPTRQSYGLQMPRTGGSAGGAERFDIVDANKITVYDIDASTASIKDLSVTTAKINDLAVNNAKINDLAVNNAKINDVSAAKLTTGVLQASQTITVGDDGGARIEIIGGGAGTAAIQLKDSGGNTTGQLLSDGTWYFGDGSGNKLYYDGSDLVLLGVDLDVSGGNIDIFDGATNVARLNVNGVIVRNQKGFFMEETTSGQYGDISVNTADEIVISTPSSEKFLIKSYDGNTNYFTISDSQGFCHKFFTTDEFFELKDGISAPDTESGYARIYVDSSDGDLKVKFGDGHVATIALDS